MLKYNDIVQYNVFLYKVIEHGNKPNTVNLVSFPNEFQTKRLFNISADKVVYKYHVGK